MILALVLALDTQKPPIVVDRPDFTEAPTVLSAGTWQWETGATYRCGDGTRRFSGPEGLLRYGVTNHAELRLGPPDAVWTPHESGIADGYAGMSFQLGPLRNHDDLALIPGINFPSREQDFSSGTVDPELKICWGRDLGKSWSVTAMAFGSWTSDNGRRAISYQQTASFDHDLAKNLDMFIEYAATFERFEAPDHVAHFGFGFRLTPDSQFDIHTGLSMAGPRRPFIGAGWAIRF